MKNYSLVYYLIYSYGSQLPYHRGKGRLLQHLLRIFDVHVDREFDVVREGLRWRLNPADFVQASLFWLGRADYYEVYRLQQILKPHSVFFDVGANFGYYSVTLASRLNKQCEVHAFEPNPTTLKLLQHHVAVNSLHDVVRTHKLALSDQVGLAALATKKGNSGGTHVVASELAPTSVQLTTLDAFCNEQQITRLDAIKIDVEGFEERVLIGGQATLKRLEPVLLMELEPPRLRDKHSTVERVVFLLHELGYQLYISHRKTLRPLLQLPTGDNEQLNVFCLPQSFRLERNIQGFKANY